LFLFLSWFLSHAQEVGIKPSTPIPAVNGTNSPADSLSIFETNETQSDTIVQDTIRPQPEILTDVVDYYGEDYVIMHRKENKIFMYNKAYVIYEDMRIDAGVIIMDYNKKEVYAKGIVDSLGNYTQMPVFVQG